LDTYLFDEVIISLLIRWPKSLCHYTAYTKDKVLLSTFEANLECLPDAKPDVETQKWWQSQPEAWEYCRSNLQSPEKAMLNYVEWLNSLSGKLIFVGYPVAYDFMFMYWYLIKFVGSSPFSHSALDIKTLAMVALNTNYHSVSKKLCLKNGLTNCHTRTKP
jgi:hypothetical protein